MGTTQLRTFSPTPISFVRRAPRHLCMEGYGAYKALPGELIIILLNSLSQGDNDPSLWLSEQRISGSSGLFCWSNHPVSSIFMTHPESGQTWAPASPSGHSTLALLRRARVSPRPRSLYTSSTPLAQGGQLVP